MHQQSRPDVHSDPCRVVDEGVMDFQEKDVRVWLDRARLMITGIRAGLPDVEGGVHAKDALKHRDAEYGLYVSSWEDVVTLEMRNPHLEEVHVDIRGLHPATSRWIRTGPRSRTKPIDAAARIIAAAQTHLDGIVRRPLDPHHLEAYRDRLHATGSHLQWRDGPDIEPDHDFGPIEAATPWSPLRCLSIDRLGNKGRDVMTSAERRRWTMEPVVMISTCMSSRQKIGFDFNPCSKLVLKPLWVGEREGSPSPIEDMRRIAALNPPPPRPKRVRP